MFLNNGAMWCAKINMKNKFLLLICYIVFLHFSNGKPFYVDYININEENTKLFYKVYKSSLILFLFSILIIVL